MSLLDTIGICSQSKKRELELEIGDLKRDRDFWREEYEKEHAVLSRCQKEILAAELHLWDGDERKHISLGAIYGMLCGLDYNEHDILYTMKDIDKYFMGEDS